MKPGQHSGVTSGDLVEGLDLTKDPRMTAPGCFSGARRDAHLHIAGKPVSRLGPQVLP